MEQQLHFKDARLSQLADTANVAQFVSFDPARHQRFARIIGFDANYVFSGVRTAVEQLLLHSPENSVNIRSFRPEEPQGHEFLYGVRAAQRVEAEVNRLTSSGLFVIVNETVDVNDGGVSGVVHGNVMEFAPGTTPRAVEAGNIASVRRSLGEDLINLVYGFRPNLPQEQVLRVEFSIHPVRRGYRREHTIIWEFQALAGMRGDPILRWPNAFSELLGDKAFGLLVCACIGLDVPRTAVYSRALRPFCFGQRTSSDVVWLRTCPKVPEPGLFPTVRGWKDPFQLIEQIQSRERLASLIVQDEVPALYSGAVLSGADGNVIIEGVRGFGDDLMLGRRGPDVLPESVRLTVDATHTRISNEIGSSRAEWAFDGERLWILQLQPEAALSQGAMIFPGHADAEIDFDVRNGLDGLRELVDLLSGKNVGIRLVGTVGMTSHIADLLRRNRIPSRIVPRSL